ncbi:MAG TPA: ATP-binding protein [Actinomycetes bacterium]
MVEASGHRVFPGRADQVARARRFAVESLDPGTEARDQVSLLVSEAVTNALLHSSSGRDQGTFEVTYALSGGRIRVEVHDGGAPVAPRRRVHGVDSMTGRGLDLFDAIADRWGFRGDEGGRVVWFELDLRKEMGDGAQAGAVRSRSARP